MHQVFAIFLRDVKRILKNPVALVVTLGVAIIPSLYAWCNILANWDPYANTGNIQVAVANEDKGTTSTLVGHLDAGQQTVNQLKKNHQLGWRFVPKQQAIEGVESGKYYAAIVLPEDFSSRLIGTVTGKGDRPSITYYINEKLNAIAPKITDTGATTIDEQINTTFVSSVADAVAKEVKEAAGETTGSVKSAQSDVVNDLTDTINQLETVQQQLRDTCSTLDKALTILNDGYAAGGKYRSTLEAGGKKTSFDAALEVANMSDVSLVYFTAEPFPFFENGAAYSVNYYPKNGGFVSEPLIGYRGTSSHPAIPYETDTSAESFYIGKCFVACQFTGTRSKHITDAKLVSSSNGIETWALTVSFADGAFTGYTAELSVDTAKSVVTQLVIRTANYTLTMTPV